MIESALAENDWVHVDKWEASKDEWTPTLEVLQYHKNEVKNHKRDQAERQEAYFNIFRLGFIPSTKLLPQLQEKQSSIFFD